VLLITLVAAGTPVRTTGQRAQPFEPPLPTGISKALWRRRIPLDNPLTRAKVALGERLYFDKRLSNDGTTSCGSCHDPANAFADHLTVAIGAQNTSGLRNTPTILNAMFVEALFWDGRANSLEEQAKQPILNPFEMAMSTGDTVVSRLNVVPEYRQQFRQAFGKEGITVDTIVKAIASYERTLISADSPFDRFIAGNSQAITPSQKRGWELFKGKAKCIECHTFSQASPFFSDFKFHNTGIVARELSVEQLSGLTKEIINNEHGDSVPSLAHTQGLTELGRFLITRKHEDIGAFRTPTLRDIELTSPYMHNGSEKTLIDVVHFYNRGGNANPNLDKRLRPLGLNDSEMNDLVEFMRALTSDVVLRRTQSSTPQNRTPVRF
jgi:cytochrome c peroxidase